MRDGDVAAAADPEPPGKVDRGKANFMGSDLLKMTPDEIRHVRGAQIGMVFQDPMTSLNPVLTIGRQLTEPLEMHLGMNKTQAASARSRCWRWSASPMGASG